MVAAFSKCVLDVVNVTTTTNFVMFECVIVNCD